MGRIGGNKMCYSGKCIYEDYMGDCRASSKIKNPCRKGHRIGKIELIKFKISSIMHHIKYKVSKKYKKVIDNLPF